MSDSIIFMSAYKPTRYSKSIMNLKKIRSLKTLLEKHHLTYMLFRDKLVSQNGILTLCTEYDYVRQSTTFSFTPASEKHKFEDFEEIIENTGFCIKLLHAQSVLSDLAYFNIDYLICMDSFLACIGEQHFQIDPVIFSMNGVLLVTFEVIDFKTGIPLKRNDVLGKMGNYNLLTVSEYQYFGEDYTTQSNDKISQIIYSNISSFLSEMLGKRFEPEEYSFVHSTLVLSNEFDNPTNYLCSLMGVSALPSPLENISTTENYEYYPQDGASIITNYNPDDIDIPLYNGIILESIKLYIYLSQIINADITRDMNEIVRNDLSLDNLFFAPSVPIETHNLLEYIYKTKSYQHHKEATKLKISYMTLQNESVKNRNATLLNILIYVISLLGIVGTLETLENKLNIPFKCSFVVVIMVFSILGVIWGVIEWQHNRRF